MYSYGDIVRLIFRMIRFVDLSSRYGVDLFFQHPFQSPPSTYSDTFITETMEEYGIEETQFEENLSSRNHDTIGQRILPSIVEKRRKFCHFIIVAYSASPICSENSIR